MATTATLNISLSWSDTDTNNANSTYSDIGSYICSRVFQTGNVYSNIGQLWHETRNLTSGEIRTYNMSALPVSIFSGSYNTNFSTIKLIYLENLATGTGQNISVYAIGLSGFSGIFNGNSGNILVPSKSPWVFMSYLTGIPTSATNNTLTIKDLGGVTGTGVPSGCQIRIGVFGI